MYCSFLPTSRYAATWHRQERPFIGDDWEATGCCQIGKEERAEKWRVPVCARQAFTGKLLCHLGLMVVVVHVQVPAIHSFILPVHDAVWISTTRLDDKMTLKGAF